jgi:hypothetical protein
MILLLLSSDYSSYSLAKLLIVNTRLIWTEQHSVFKVRK